MLYPLGKNKSCRAADYWTDAQRQFLAEKIKSDGEWAIIVDQLNESLHEDSVLR